jgi:hypothetical protein
MADSTPSTPGRVTNRSRWALISAVLAAVIAILLVLALVPLNPVTAPSVKWFGVTLVATSEPDGGYGDGYEIAPLTFCPPANAVGPGVVSLSWRTVSGSPLTSFAAGQTPVTLGPEVFWVYQDNNSSFGGYSISTALPFECGYSLFIAIYSASQQTVKVTGTFAYNSTTYQPIL